MATKAKKKQRSDTRHTARRARKRSTAAAKPFEGPAVELLRDDKTITADMDLIREAVSEDWPVTRDIMQTSVDRLDEIQKKKTVAIPCGEGVFMSDAVADANAMKAIALLKSMGDANSKRKHPQQPQSSPTFNVVQQIVNQTDERRDRTLAIAERVRAGRVLQHVDATGD